MSIDRRDCGMTEMEEDHLMDLILDNFEDLQDFDDSIISTLIADETIETEIYKGSNTFFEQDEWFRDDIRFLVALNQLIKNTGTYVSHLDPEKKSISLRVEAGYIEYDGNILGNKPDFASSYVEDDYIEPEEEDDDYDFYEELYKRNQELDEIRRQEEEEEEERQREEDELDDLIFWHYYNEEEEY